MDPVIVFDLGKVLVDFDYTIAAEKISARCAHPPAPEKYSTTWPPCSSSMRPV